MKVKSGNKYFTCEIVLGGLRRFYTFGVIQWTGSRGRCKYKSVSRIFNRKYTIISGKYKRQSSVDYRGVD